MPSLNQPIPCNQKQRRAGFSLLELSVVTVIISIVAVLGLEGVAIYMNRTAYKVTVERLEIVDQAMARYARTYNRLPCPSLLADTITASCYGKERNGSGGAGTCNDTAGQCRADAITGGFYGHVPARDLGLPLTMMVDGYGNRLLYVVTANQVYNSTYHATNNFAQTPDGIAVRSGKIDQACGGAGQLCQNRGNASYFLLSVGADRRGSTTPLATGKRCYFGSTAAIDGKIDTVNCRMTDPGALTLQKTGGVNIAPDLATNIFYDSRYNAGTQEYSHFDDVVKWRAKGGI